MNGHHDPAAIITGPDGTTAPVGPNGVHVDVRSSALPAGAATQASLSELVAALVHGRDGNGHLLVATRHNQWEARFFEHSPSNILDVVVAGAGSAFSHEGHAHFESGATAGGSVQATMREPPRYAANYATFWAFTACFSPVTGTGKVEIGPTNDTDGYVVRRTAAGMSVVHLRNGVEEVVPQVSWNGEAASRFTRGGVAEAIDWSKKNVFVVTQLWLGSGPTTIWVSTPDANERGSAVIPLHTFRHPNTSEEVSTLTPNLPIRATAQNGGTAENVALKSGCWVVGNASPDRIALQSVANSSTANLGAGATFLGKYVSMLHHRFLSVLVDANQDGSLVVEWSKDGAAVDFTEPSVSYAAADGAAIFNFPRRLEYFRLRYVNGGGAQTAFELRAELTETERSIPRGILKEQMGKGIEAVPTKAALFALEGNQTKQVTGGALSDAYSQSSKLALDERSMLHAYNGSTWDRARGDVANGLDVDVTRSALPSGAATATNQTSGAQKTQLVDGGGTAAEVYADGSLQTRAVDLRTILDYDGRTDGNPVYVGVNAQAALVGDATWYIKKLFYDASARLVDVQILIGAWSGRAALGWRTSGGD